VAQNLRVWDEKNAFLGRKPRIWEEKFGNSRYRLFGRVVSGTAQQWANLYTNGSMIA